MVNLNITINDFKKLDIHENSVLLLKKPFDAQEAEVQGAIKIISDALEKRFGFATLLITMPKEIDLALLTIPELERTRLQIDAALQYLYARKGQHEGES